MDEHRYSECSAESENKIEGGWEGEQDRGRLNRKESGKGEEG